MSEPQDTPTTEASPPAAPVDQAAVDRARRGRNLAIALGLIAFVVLVYAVTLIRMGGSVAARPF